MVVQVPSCSSGASYSVSASPGSMIKPSSSAAEDSPARAQDSPPLSTPAAVGLILLSSVLASLAMLSISASKVDGKEQYCFVTVTFCGEACKLVVVCSAYKLSTWNSRQAYTPIEANLPNSSTEWYLYAVPAFLYMVDNNLAFIILEYIDPATLSLVWNVKILQTAFLFRFFLGRRMTVLRWCSVLMLFFGIVGSQSSKIHHCDTVGNGTKTETESEFKDE